MDDPTRFVVHLYRSGSIYDLTLCGVATRSLLPNVALVSCDDDNGFVNDMRGRGVLCSHCDWKYQARGAEWA